MDPQLDPVCKKLPVYPATSDQKSVPKENPLDRVFKVMKNKKDHLSLALFDLDKNSKDVDLKSDLAYPEDIFVVSLETNDAFLESRGLTPIYKKYTDNLLRKRFSLDRGSRKEFVEINKKDTMDDGLKKLGTMKNLTEVRS